MIHSSILNRFRHGLLAGALVLMLVGSIALADSTKSLSGKLRRVEGNVLSVVKKSLGGSSLVEVEFDDKTRVVGQLVPGMMLKIKYREETSEGGAVRRVAMQIEAVPDHASKAARGAIQETKPKQ
jgi:hypothetical protein